MKRLKPALLAVCLSCGLAASAFAADAVKTRPFNAMPADFIKGADISTLLEAEQHGAKFYNQSGQQQDAIAILKANGVNYVRLRLWVDPKDAEGNTYGGGSNNLENTIKLAKRVKAQGMKLLLDFHYSDFWTDPGKQFKPKAWEKMDYPQLKTAIHEPATLLPALRKRVCCRTWCRLVTKLTVECCGQKGKAGGRAAASLIAWPGYSTPRLAG